MLKSQEKKNNKVTVVLPAFNAERTLEKIYKGIPKKKVHHIILVDDGSKDNTASLSRKLGIKTIIHNKNRGYGANQKTLYKEALKKKTDFIIMLHPDGQYNPKDLPLFISALKERRGDIILGSRFLSTEGDETPFYKALSIKIITVCFNIV